MSLELGTRLYLRDGTLVEVVPDIERILDEVVFIDKGKIILQSEADKLRTKENASIDEVFRRMFKC